MQHDNGCPETSAEPKPVLPFAMEFADSCTGKKRMPGRPKGSCNKYPGKKRFPGRPRGSSAKFTPELRKKRGPKGKLKPYPPTGGLATVTGVSDSNFVSVAVSGVGSSVTAESFEPSKEKSKEEEPAYENKVILCSTKDDFVLSQDLCAMCGSLGVGEEGKLIACSQCGQCYHPYCVNIKVTKVIINKGWRCLECTVCEGCGQPHDEARLLLCDECDISYHTYCLETPLDEVPQGTWKCRWCVVCVKCGSTTPGYKSLWQKNYTECGPCSSKTTCPVCTQDYTENDLIIQCIQCSRWLHAKCDGMNNEEDCESAADFGYHCIICRPKDEPPSHIQARKQYAMEMQHNAKSSGRADDISDSLSVVAASLQSASRRSSIDSLSSKILNTESNLNVTAALTTNSAQRESLSSTITTFTSLNPLSATTAMNSTAMSTSLLCSSKTNSKYQPQYLVDGVLLSETGMNQIKSLYLEQPKRQRAKRGAKNLSGGLSGISPLRTDDIDDSVKDDETASVDDTKLQDDTKQEEIERKKRQRRLQKLGIGGFTVKQRGRLSKDEENDVSIDGISNEAEVANTNSTEKPKRRRRAKKKSQLQDNYPSYLQEAFFGKSLLDSSKDTSFVNAFSHNPLSSMEFHSEDELQSLSQLEKDKTIHLNQNEVNVKAVRASSDLRNSIDSSSNGALDDDLNNSEAFRDLLPLPQDLPQDDDFVTMLMNEADDLDKNDEVLDDIPVDEKNGDDVGKDDPMDSLLSPHFNLDTIGDTGLPHMDSKDVEDVFKVVFNPLSDSNETNETFATMSPLNSMTPVTASLNNVVKTPPVNSASFPLQMPLSRPTLQPAQSSPDFIPSAVSVSNPGTDLPYSIQRPISFPQALSSVVSKPSTPTTPTPTPTPTSSDVMSPWPVEPETETTSQGQKNIQKWENDETLGHFATISPVLYANINFPNLKLEYPNWNDRVKQISKCWRQLGTEQRQPYLQKARENRAASRMQKSQAEQGKSSAKEGRPLKDTDQERQWKQMQSSRQAPHQQVIPEQRSLTKSVSVKSEGSVSEAGNEMDPYFVQNTSEMDQSQNSFVQKSEAQIHAENSPQTMNDMKNHLRISLPMQTLQNSTSQGCRMSVSSPSSQLIQVSRVRPPIEANRIPQPLQPDPYGNPPSTPRPSTSVNVPSSATSQKPPFSPSSPATSLSQAMSVVSDDFQTSPQTPRTQSCEMFTSHLQSGPPPSPYTQQPKTPRSTASPFSPTAAKPSMPTPPDVYSQATNSTRSQPQQVPPPPPSPLDSYSPMSHPHTPISECYSPSTRMTPTVPTEAFAQAPSTPRSDTSSPYSRHPSTPISQHQEFSQPSSASDPYSHPPMTPRPQVQYDSNDPYSRQVPTPRPPDPYARPTNVLRPSQAQDPYAYQPLTPRPHFSGRVPTQSLMSPRTHAVSQSSVSSDPYAHQPMTPMPSSHDPYAKPPLTPMPVSENSEGSEGPGRQQLRDLLQKQMRRNSDNSMPQWSEQANTMSPRLSSDNQLQRLPINPQQLRSGQNDGFRPPFPPTVGIRPRIMHSNENQLFRHPADGRMISFHRVADPRVRVAVMQQHFRNQQLQQQQQHHQQQLPQQQQWRFPTPMQRLQLQQRLPIQGTSNEAHYNMISSQIANVRPPLQSPITVQQAIQPQVYLPSQSQENVSTPPPSTSQMLQPEKVFDQQAKTSDVDIKPSDDNAIAKRSLMKQEEVQEQSELPELDSVAEDLDDDELLGLGNDFNILEYADPELDKALVITGGNKNNIFDEHFDDLVEKDELGEKSRNQGLKSIESESKIQQNDSEKDKSKLPSKEEQKDENKTCSVVDSIAGTSISPRNMVSQTQNPPPPYPGLIATDSRFSAPPPPPYESRQTNELQVRPMNQRPYLHKNDQNQVLPLIDDNKRDIRITSDSLIGHNDPLLSDIEFERLKADIFSDDSLSVPTGPLMHNSPMQSPTTQMSSQPFSANIQQLPPNQWMEHSNEHYQHMLQASRVPPQRHPALANQMQPRLAPMAMSIRLPNSSQQSIVNPGQPHMHPSMGPVRRQSYQLMSLPPPPTPPPEIVTEQDRQMHIEYEAWLERYRNQLNESQKVLEAEVTKLRKVKKTLNAKQRQLRKNGNELSEVEANDLSRVIQELSVKAKNLEKHKKDCRQHSMLIEGHKLKQQKRQVMLGAPSAGPQVAASPTTTISCLPTQGQPRPPPSPMLMGPSGPGTPLGMGTPSTPLAAPGTPQSPAIMSPSPIAPSPSPLTQHSPASLQHSPASNVPPASPMMQSPIYQQQPSPIHIHPSLQSVDSTVRPQGQPQTVMQEESNPYSDMYQQKERVMLHNQLRSPIQGGNQPNFQKQQVFESVAHQQGFPNVQPMRMPNPNLQNVAFHPRPGEPIRYGNQHSPRTYSDMSGKPFSISGNQQMFVSQASNQQQILVRRMPPPPPYSSHFHQTPTRMYGKPQIANQQFAQQRMIQNVRLPQNVQQMRIPISSESAPNYIMAGQSPIATMVRQQQPQQQQMLEQGIHQELHQHQQQILQHNETSDVDKTELSDVGEAKTSFTLSFEEPGNGNDNEAVNDTAESCSTENEQQNQNIAQVKSEATEFANCSHKSACDNMEAIRNNEINIKTEDHRSIQEIETGDQSYVFSQQNLTNEAMQMCENLQRDEELCFNEMGTTKQNVLLKQLLQNCPSADSQNSQHVEEDKEKPTKEAVEPATDAADAAVAATVNNVVVSNDSNQSISQVQPTNVEARSTCVTPTLAAPEKKMSYLDIRRAQLEREPTPPPEEMKPKRKRVVKRKEVKSGESNAATIKKRSRKASNSRPDEDYEIFLSSLMSQLRSLPPMHIVEPTIRPNFNIFSVFGSPDLNAKESLLRGSYGRGYSTNFVDCYSNEVFGNKSLTPSKLQESNTITTTRQLNPNTGRGFYNQEFSKGTLLGSQYYLGQQSSEYRCNLRDTDSPESIISSSSPECCLYEEYQNTFRYIRVIKEESEQTKFSSADRLSPEIPIIMPIPVRPEIQPLNIEKVVEAERRTSMESDSEKDKENMLDTSKNGLKMRMNPNILPVPLRDTGNVAVTLTLSSADDIKGILHALSKILEIVPPVTYDIVERTSTPPSQKLGLYSNKDGESDVNIQNMLNGEMKFCRFCEIVIMKGAIQKKVSELPLSAREDLEEEEVSFCSSNCYMQFALSNRLRSSAEEKEVASIVTHTGSIDSKNNLDFTVKDRNSLNLKPPLDLLPPMSPMMEEDDISDRNSVSLPMSPRSITVGSEKSVKSRKQSWIEEETNEAMLSPKPVVKKWKSIKYKYWNNNIFESTVKKEVEDSESSDLRDYEVCVRPENLAADERKCALCHDVGDGKSDGCARLLNMDVDKWVHLNCALWSSEVYETVNGSLINVDLACKRALNLSCVRCQRNGASLKCFRVRCTNVYHFPCAIKDRCMFFKDKTLFCPLHVPKMPNPDAELNSFVVYRRVYVNRDEHKQVANMLHQADKHLMRIGSMIFLNHGQLLFHQLQAFHTPTCIYPVGYKIVRFYWSMRYLRKRCKYICSINDMNGHPEFVVEVEEEGFENIVFKSFTPKGVWQKIISPIIKMRQEAQTIKVFGDYISGEDLFGMTEPAVIRILESLHGVDTLSDYNFRYGRSQFLELPPIANPTGCARTEPKDTLRTHFKRPHTLHTSNATRSSLQPSFSGMEIQSPYIKQFVHSKSSQYRKMKTEWRNNVFLARSRIQGLGLCAARDIEKHTMVIEYIGQLIRNEIAERNERLYEAQNRRGVYMFRLDENRVVDATLCGGLARYVNHSCNPNCVAEVVQIDRENKILIIANRRILRGEELTYDYRFEVEDDSHKIKCNCGAENCRQWMN